MNVADCGNKIRIISNVSMMHYLVIPKLELTAAALGDFIIIIDHLLFRRQGG